MSRLNVGRFERLASLAFNIKGPGALTELEDSIFGTLELDANGPLEYGLPQQIARYGLDLFQAAVAGEFTYLSLNNPVGSNVLAVVELIAPSSAQALIHMTRGQPPGIFTVGPIAGDPLDTRLQNTVPSRVSMWTGTDPAAAFGTRIFSLIGTDPLTLPIVLAPDGTLTVRANAVNTGMSCSLIWRERPAEPGELLL